MGLGKALLLILMGMSFASCSFHLYTKEEVLKNAKKKSKVRQIIDESDNTVTILTRDSNYQKLDVIYAFDNAGKQLNYTLTASCDSCFQKLLKQRLRENAYRWKKINDSTYLSKYTLKRYLHIHKSIHSYNIVQHNLSKTEYNILILKFGN